MSFKQRTPYRERLDEVIRVKRKYPDRIPVICEKNTNDRSNCPVIDKNKYLVPYDLTAGQFLYIIRKRINVNNDKALFLFINGITPSTSTRMSTLYDIYKDKEDGFLYITYAFENTFG